MTPEEKQERVKCYIDRRSQEIRCVVCDHVVYPVCEGLLTLEFVELLEARGGSKMKERLEIYKRNLDTPIYMCDSCKEKFNERSWFFHRQSNEDCRVSKNGCEHMNK